MRKSETNSRAVSLLAGSVVNGNADKLAAALDLANLVALMATCLSPDQRYTVADHLRDISDQIERVDVVAHRSHSLGGGTQC
jgi:hypothetical protein